MALRLASSRFLGKCSSGIINRVCVPLTARAMSSNAASGSTAVAKSDDTLPSVSDVIVKLTFVDPSGARRQVPGLIGKTLWETCEMHGIDIGPASVGGVEEAVRSDTWTEPLYGEGPTSGFDHVLLTGNGAETAEPKTPMEEKMLEEYWDDDELYPESRLACMVKLTKEMDGMTVYVPDRLVDNIP